MAKVIHYMVVAQYQKVLADFSKGKQNYSQFTSNILKGLKKGRYSLPYEE
jgi:hypothetical protein